MSCLKILKSGAKIEPLTEEEQNTINNGYDYTIKYVRVQPERFITLELYIEFADRYFDFKFKNDDILIMGHPKSGTTWTEEILWTMIHNPSFSNEEAKKPLSKRVPFFEMDIMRRPILPSGIPGNKHSTKNEPLPYDDPKYGSMLEAFENMKCPRIAQTHLLLSLLPEDLLDTCKVVYIARNPKDLVVSHWHFSRVMKFKSYKGSLHQFTENFINGLGVFSPYWGSVKQAWKKRDHPNLHFMFYEDLKENPKREFTRLQNFLGVDLTEEQINGIIQYTRFDVMKEREDFHIKNRGVYVEGIEEIHGGFFRKGVIGDSKNNFTEEQIAKMDEWINDNTKDMSSDFKYKV